MRMFLVTDGAASYRDPKNLFQDQEGEKLNL